jgi:hypothetical protein
MKRLLGYLIGIALTLFGIVGYVSEITNAQSHNPILGYALSSVIFFAGILMIAGVAMRYGGGLWTTVGYLLTAIGVLYVTTTFEDYLRKSEKPSSREFLVCSVVLSLGIAFVGQGHRRHLWKRRNESDGPVNLNSNAEPSTRSLVRSAPWAPAWLGVVFGIWFLWHHFDTVFKFRAFAKAWQKEGLPLTLNELNQWYKPVDANENAALVYEGAFTNLVAADVPQLKKFAIRHSTNAISTFAPERAEIQGILSRNSKALALLHAATTNHQSRYSVELRDGGMLKLSHLNEIVLCEDLLALENVGAALDGRQDEAVKSFTTMLALGDSLAQEPFFESQACRESCNYRMGLFLQAMLQSYSLTEPQLAQLSEALNRTEATADYTGAYLGEFCRVMQAEPSYCIDQVYEGHPFQSAFCKALVVIFDREAADKQFYANSVKLCLKALNNPYPLRVGMLLKPCAPAQYAYAKRHGFFVSAWRFEWQPALIMNAAENVARLRVLQTVVAIERYQNANRGELPQTLTELCPRYLTSAPIDPFDGYPLRFRRSPQGYAVYSVGKDMKDNGGEGRKPGQKWVGEFDIVTKVERRGDSAKFTKVDPSNF